MQKALPEIPRFILWDTLGEYEGYTEVTNKQELFDYVYGRSDGVLQVIYNTVEDEDFIFMCTLAGGLSDLTVIIEEVDNYATPNFCRSN